MSQFLIPQKEDYQNIKIKSPVNLSIYRTLCGETGSRTYAFRKYHKIANH